MRTPIAATRVALLLTVTLAISSRCGATSETNGTAVSLEDEEDDALLDMTFDEFKERYRRLIPYMTFFVANNYVSAQTPTPQPFVSEASASPLIQRHPQRTLTRLQNVPRPRPGSKYRTNPQSDKKFIPSVQYDPRELGSDNDYFTPVRYSSKINYEDYPSSSYQIYQNQKPAYPEITSVAGQNAQSQESAYYTNVRLPRPYAPASNVREYSPRKPSVRPVPTSLHDDYLSDYVPRPTAKPSASYPIEQLRYIPSPQGQQHAAGRQPHRNPTNLNHLLESFQLSERLPDALNKDNIDSSIKTLVEILNILQNSKQEEFPQSHASYPPLSLPLPAPPLLPAVPQIPLRHPSKLSGYETIYKQPRPYTRPKVVTETRFQATPSPLMFTDDPERFKSGPTYDEDVKPESAQQPHSYNVNGLGNGKILEYYRPYVQDTNGGDKDAFLPTVKPQLGKGTTEHSYEITEDLSDDVLHNGRFRVPATTTTKTTTTTTTTEKAASGNYKNFAKSGSSGTNYVSSNVPKTALKYGVTRGKPNVDYPAYSTIPETEFSCKEQRYKGFFGDPATGCQVWHYCDLNGGKASFLCPNGTIFSQVALTCDWWFNVKCESTTQLYVLNERLYKYILPIMPKFPEDFTGPEVDRYLEIKFKEMEAKLKEKKLKKQQEAKEKALKEKNKHQMHQSVDSEQ